MCKRVASDLYVVCQYNLIHGTHAVDSAGGENVDLLLKQCSGCFLHAAVTPLGSHGFRYTLGTTVEGTKTEIPF
jgi:hypothetical protein